jgi:hypothetical protein
VELGQGIVTHNFFTFSVFDSMTGTRYFEQGQKTTPNDPLQFPLPDVPADWKRRILNTLQMCHHDYPFLIVVYCLLSIYYLLIESILINNFNNK